MKRSLAFLAFAAPVFAGLDGLWEGFCDNLPNNLPNATYNYRFHNGHVETYLQYYNDKICSPHQKGITMPQAQGSYQVTNSQSGGQETYEVLMNFGQGQKNYQISIANSTMKICSLSPYSCWSYTRR